MPVRQLKKNKWTKDGRSWIFYLYERQIDGTLKQYTSKAFLTKEEAEREELAYRDKYLTSSVNPHMTFREAYLKFYEYKGISVRLKANGEPMLDKKCLEEKENKI